MKRPCNGSRTGPECGPEVGPRVGPEEESELREEVYPAVPGLPYPACIHPALATPPYTTRPLHRTARHRSVTARAVRHSWAQRLILAWVGQGREASLGRVVLLPRRFLPGCGKTGRAGIG